MRFSQRRLMTGLLSASFFFLVVGPAVSGSQRRGAAQERRTGGARASQEAVKTAEGIFADLSRELFTECNGSFYTKVVSPADAKVIRYEEYRERPRFIHEYDRFISELDRLNGLEYFGKLELGINGNARRSLPSGGWGPYYKVGSYESGRPGQNTIPLLKLKRINGRWNYEYRNSATVYLAPSCEEVRSLNHGAQDSAYYRFLVGNWNLVWGPKGQETAGTLVVRNDLSAVFYEGGYETSLKASRFNSYVARKFNGLKFAGAPFEFLFEPVGGRAFLVWSRTGTPTDAWEPVTVKARESVARAPEPNRAPKQTSDRLSPLREELDKQVSAFVRSHFTSCDGRLYTVETYSRTYGIWLYQVDGLERRVIDDGGDRNSFGWDSPQIPDVKIVWSPMVILYARNVERIYPNSRAASGTDRNRGADPFIRLKYVYGQDRSGAKNWYGPYPDVPRRYDTFGARSYSEGVMRIGNFCAPSCDVVRSPDTRLRPGRRPEGINGLSCPPAQ